MTYYAEYRSSDPAPQRVIGWYDTEINTRLPDPDDRLEITREQWMSRAASPSNWQINDGQLEPWIPPPPPAPTPEQEAASALRAGVLVESVSEPTINATYRCDLEFAGSLQGIAAFVAQNQRFPGKSNQLAVKDHDGVARTFTSTVVFQSFALELADYSAELNNIANGLGGELPAPSITIA